MSTSTTLGTLAVKLRADAAQFVRDIKSARGELGSISTTATQVAKISGAAFAAMTGIGLVATKIAADFEAGMVRVKAVSQATAAQFGQLKQSALDFAGSTRYTAREVSQGMGFMAMAGFKTADIIDTMPSVLQLASAGMIELGDAADITTNVLTGMGMEAKDLGRVNDILVSAMTGANVNTRMLGEAFKYVGPVAKSAGVKFEEVTGAIALLGNAGIQGSMAGTTLRQAIARLLRPVGEAKDVIRKLGLNVKDSSGRLVSLTSIIRQLENKSASASDIMALFGERAGPGMAALVEQGADAFDKFSERLEESGGIAKRIADENMKTLIGKLLILKSGAEKLAITIGNVFIPAAKVIVDMATQIVGWFNDLSEETQEWIAWLGAAAAGLAGAVFAASSFVAILPILVTYAGAVVVALKGIAVAAAIVGPLVAAAAAAISIFGKDGETAFQTITRWAKEFGSWVNNVWQNKVKPFVEGFGDGFSEGAAAVQQAWGLIKESIVWAMEDIVGAFEGGVSGTEVNWKKVGWVVGEVVGAIIGAIAMMIAGVVRFGAFASSTLIPFGKIIVGWIIEPVKLVGQFLGRVYDGFKEIFSGNVIQGLKRIGLALVDFVFSPMRLVLRQAIKLVDFIGAFEVPEAIRKFAEEGFSGFADLPEPPGGEEKKKKGWWYTIGDIIIPGGKGGKGAGGGPGAGVAGGGSGGKLITTDQLFQKQLASTDIEIVDEAEAQAKTIGDALSYAGDTLVDAIVAGAGTLGDVVEGAKAGMEAGGPWGAVIGAIVALLQKTEFFAGIIENVNEALDGVVGGLDRLLSPLDPMLDILTELTIVTSEMLWGGAGLVAVFDVLRYVFGAISGSLNLVLAVAKPFVGIVNLVGTQISGMTMTILGFGAMTSKLGEAADWVATVMANVVQWIGDTWNWMIDQLASFAEWLKLDDLADAIRSAKMSTQDIAEAAGVVGYEGGDGGGGGGGDGQVPNWPEGGDETMRALNSSMTNIPEGYKVAAARYEATQVGGEGLTQQQQRVTLDIELTDDAAEIVRVRQQEDNHRSKGTLYGGPAFSVPGNGA